MLLLSLSSLKGNKKREEEPAGRPWSRVIEQIINSHPKVVRDDQTSQGERDVCDGMGAPAGCHVPQCDHIPKQKSRKFSSQGDISAAVNVAGAMLALQ